MWSETGVAKRRRSARPPYAPHNGSASIPTDIQDGMGYGIGLWNRERNKALPIAFAEIEESCLDENDLLFIPFPITKSTI